MKTCIVIVFCATSSFILTGCGSLPKVASAEELTYQRSDPFGGSTISAKGIKWENGKLSVDEYSRSTHYPSLNQSVTIKGAKFEKAEDLVK